MYYFLPFTELSSLLIITIDLFHDYIKKDFYCSGSKRLIRPFLLLVSTCRVHLIPTVWMEDWFMWVHIYTIQDTTTVPILSPLLSERRKSPESYSLLSDRLFSLVELSIHITVSIRIQRDLDTIDYTIGDRCISM